MYLDLLRITFPGNASSQSAPSNLPDVSCTCKTISMENNCEHVKSSTGNLENKKRIMVISSRDVRSIENGRIVNDWEIYAVPNNRNDDVYSWHALRRNNLSSTFKTSGTVLLDMRKSRILRRCRERVLCAIYPGFAKNRLLCVHETVALLYISGDGDSVSNSIANISGNT